MFGIIICIAAGAAMSIQGVMNTRLGESIGTSEANAFVQATAAVLALGVLIFHRDGSFSALGETSWLYMLGGVLGLVITLTVMLGMHVLTPATAVSIILVSQLLTAGAIDALGLMGTERVPLTWSKALGAALMIAGVIIFKR